MHLQCYVNWLPQKLNWPQRLTKWLPPRISVNFIRRRSISSLLCFSSARLVENVSHGRTQLQHVAVPKKYSRRSRGNLFGWPRSIAVDILVNHVWERSCNLKENMSLSTSAIRKWKILNSSQYHAIGFNTRIRDPAFGFRVSPGRNGWFPTRISTLIQLGECPIPRRGVVEITGNPIAECFHPSPARTGS